MPRVLFVFVLALLAAASAASADPPRRNLIIFVADGLRSGIVDDATAPALAAVKREGVYFAESHSLFPTVTTANASDPADGGFVTQLDLTETAGRSYYDEAGAPGRTFGLRP